MSDANDAKDLDKYGVWVKNSPKDIKGEDLPENAIDDIDLPSDDDMFNDIEFPLTAEDLKEPDQESEISDLDIDIDIPLESDGGSEYPAAADENSDTTLSPDELSNITGEMDGGADENADATLSPDELLNITENQEIPSEKAAPQEGGDGLDDFNLDGLDITEDSPATEADGAAAEESQEISLDDMPDGEIDLDDFMSDSGSSETPAASAPDGDVDLSAFIDDAPSPKKEPKPEEIQDEKSLDIDISFDDSAEEIAQEDTSDDNPPPQEPETERGPDEMFDSIGEPSPDKPAGGGPEVSGDTEEIDLSDFGFDDDDANIGMTNGPDGGGQAKKEVVDYDMKVSADDDSKTPSVQDVVMGNVESFEETEINETEGAEVSSAPEAAEDLNGQVSEAGKEILNQIMGELSSLKDEIKNLKNDFAELKDRPSPAAEAADKDYLEIVFPVGFFFARESRHRLDESQSPSIFVSDPIRVSWTQAGGVI